MSHLQARRERLLGLGNSWRRRISTPSTCCYTSYSRARSTYPGISKPSSSFTSSSNEIRREIRRPVWSCFSSSCTSPRTISGRELQVQSRLPCLSPYLLGVELLPVSVLQTRRSRLLGPGSCWIRRVPNTTTSSCTNCSSYSTSPGIPKPTTYPNNCSSTTSAEK